MGEPFAIALRAALRDTGDVAADADLTRTRLGFFECRQAADRLHPFLAGVDLFKPLRRANDVVDQVRELLIGHGAAYPFEAGGQRRAQLLGAFGHLGRRMDEPA